jgi:dihydrofolate reductase
MRKVFLFMMVTLDGYHEGVDHDISWHNARSEEFDKFASAQLGEADTLIFGRRTYDLMAGFWPTDEGKEADPETARIMTETPKVVFTATPLADTWQNTESSDNVTSKMAALKAAEGKDIAVLGSNNLCVTLLREGLLDEIRIMINPVVIGRGTPLFAGLDIRKNFELTDTRVFGDGNVLLTYKTI